MVLVIPSPAATSKPLSVSCMRRIKEQVRVVLEPFSYSSKSTGAHVIPLQSFASIPLFQTVSENIIFPVLLVHFSYGLEEA
jgi:hypothetical protein